MRGLELTAEPYAGISETAVFVAYLRSFGNIPAAAEMYAALRRAKLSDAQRDAGLVFEKFHWLAPIVEARYRSISEQIAAAGFDQVLELGSGYSLRIAEKRDLKLRRFVDTDLAPVIAAKKNLTDALALGLYRDGDALAPLDVTLASDWAGIRQTLLVEAPIAVVNEGLTQYFTRAELAQVAEQVAALLRERGGCWITTDPSTAAQYARYYEYSDDMHELSAARTAATQRNLLDFAFQDHAEIRAFFRCHGLIGEPRPMFDLRARLASPHALGIDIDPIRDFFAPLLFVWVFKPG